MGAWPTDRLGRALLPDPALSDAVSRWRASQPGPLLSITCSEPLLAGQMAQGSGEGPWDKDMDHGWGSRGKACCTQGLKVGGHGCVSSGQSPELSGPRFLKQPLGSVSAVLSELTRQSMWHMAFIDPKCSGAFKGGQASRVTRTSWLPRREPRGSGFSGAELRTTKERGWQAPRTHSKEKSEVEPGALPSLPLKSCGHSGGASW